MRLFPSRPCEHPASALLALRVPDPWHVETVCRACGAHVCVPTGTVLAVQVRDRGLVDPVNPMDEGGILHVQEVVRRSA